jgi:hypothetical protein
MRGREKQNVERNSTTGLFQPKYPDFTLVSGHILNRQKFAVLIQQKL